MEQRLHRDIGEIGNLERQVKAGFRHAVENAGDMRLRHADALGEGLLCIAGFLEVL